MAQGWYPIEVTNLTINRGVNFGILDRYIKMHHTKFLDTCRGQNTGCVNLGSFLTVLKQKSIGLILANLCSLSHGMKKSTAKYYFGHSVQPKKKKESRWVLNDFPMKNGNQILRCVNFGPTMLLQCIIHAQATNFIAVTLTVAVLRPVNKAPVETGCVHRLLVNANLKALVRIVGYFTSFNCYSSFSAS